MTHLGEELIRRILHDTKLRVAENVQILQMNLEGLQ